MDTTLNATFQFDCLQATLIDARWRVYSVPSVSHVPDWNQPLDVPQLSLGATPAYMRIPPNSLSWGVYVFNFTLDIYTARSNTPVAAGSDAVYVSVVRSDLQAVVVPAGPRITINFTDALVLNGTGSSDPDSSNSSTGLLFSWYCTTDNTNYQGERITLVSTKLCLAAKQTDLRWKGVSGPILSLLPRTLRGRNVYYFRMVIRKGSRTAFADRRVDVLLGPTPAAHISCVENCDNVLVISARFSLFLNCPACAGEHNSYNWSVLSTSGKEIAFDWAKESTTGRTRAHLSIKAFAFRAFSEAEFWLSLYSVTWSGAPLKLKYSFTINHAPETGKCNMTPTQGLAFLTKFVIRCTNFTDKDIPLTYKMVVSDLYGFGQMGSVKENPLGAILHWGPESTSPPSFLPVGVLANHYVIKVAVQVYDSLGAYTLVALHATVRPPMDRISSRSVLDRLFNFTMGPSSPLSTLLDEQAFLPAGYLIYISASIVNNMETNLTLQADKIRLREHLVNQTFLLPNGTLEEISQVVMCVTKVTQTTSGFSRMAHKLAMLRTWQANHALRQSQQTGKPFDAEQIEIVSTGILTSLSNILKLTVHYEVIDEPFYGLELLADTILAGMVPGNETIEMTTSSFNMYIKKVEKRDIEELFSSEELGRNRFHLLLNSSSVPSMPEDALITIMFCEFADDPFPWLTQQEMSSVEVVGFRMTGVAADGNVIEITPDVAEMHMVRKNLNSAAFNLTVGPDNAPGKVNELFKRTTGEFSFEVDSSAVNEVLVHIVTEVTLVFTASVYAGREITPAALVATFFVPYDIPPISNQSELFDGACAVKAARVICLPLSLLQLVAQRGSSSECTMTVTLHAPRFVMAPSTKLVRIALFSVQCLDMYGIQSDWREDSCVVGEKATWDKMHCVCKSPRRARRQLDAVARASAHLQTHFLTAKVIVVPNPVDLRLELIKSVPQNPVTLFVVLFIMLTYVFLAFWALHKDAMDQLLRQDMIILPDNDPYDKVCYLLTIFTGARYGAGTRASVFIQLKGTEGDSSVHCLSHPYFTTLYRGSINTFLLTTKSDLGDIHSIRVWHNNEGRTPSWYLSRIKVENLFSRHIWLFLCRKWLSVDTSLDRTFHAISPNQPLNKKDYFLIDLIYKLGRNHMWFSVFSGVSARPFNRLQRLSCCLAMLLSSLLCNIMFFNLNKKEDVEADRKYIRSVMIGLESVLITLPVQLLIAFLFTYSQKEARVTLQEASPLETPFVPVSSEYWEERLRKWHAEETEGAPGEGTRKPARGKSARLHRKAPNRGTVTKQHPHKKAESKVPHPQEADAHAGKENAEGSGGGAPARQPSQENPPELQKQRIVLPWCFVYIAWFLVFATCSVSAFFIVFYGLTYGYEKSIEWLFASFCAFCMSIFLVQPSKIILLSGFRTSRTKYCKNLSWASRHHYTEMKLFHVKMTPEEMRRRHEQVTQLRSSRMYQPLTDDEVRIFQRKRRVKRRALLFLSYILTHFLFLALLLSLVALLRHTDSFHYNQFIRDQFSAGLGAVTRLEDIYGWLGVALLPLLHNDPMPTFLPDSSSRILGLPLLRQVRARPGERLCPPAKDFAQDSVAREIRCHPEYGRDPEDTESYSNGWNRVSKRAADKNTDGFTYKPPEKTWVYFSHGLLHTYGSGGYGFYFFPEQQRFNSSLRLQELQSSDWLDERTWAVILELSTFNPDVCLFCSVSVIFEASQLGVVNTSISTHSFSLANFDRRTSTELYLYVAVLIFFFAYAVDEGYVILQEGTSYVTSVYNLLNLALKCSFAVLIALFLRKHFLATSIVQFHLWNPAEFVPFHAVSRLDHVMRVILGFLLFLSVLKTLRYSRFFYNVRLAQRAIQAALPGICHVALVVALYLFVYVAFGYLVFGQHEWNYSNLIHATQTIFAYCVSAFQNTEFSDDRVLGVLFLSSFLLGMICILINLFQAVILSSYEEMKQPVYEEPSDEAEAMTYLCRRLRAVCRCLPFRPKDPDEPEFFEDMLYGQPEKNSRRHLGLKTRNVNGKKMVYLVV
uniref:Polycystin family receptor for egg jelly n=2 Tax=Suricata suricatta TaxID=37032 RepID=A0A673TZ99_SURSU